MSDWKYLNNLKPGKSGFKRNQFSRTQFLVFLLAFSLIGYLIFRSFALNPNLPGDLNNDNTVNITDMSILLSNYGTTNTTADINSDGTVNVLDLSILLSHYGQSIVQAVPSIPTGLSATAGSGSVALKWAANPSADQVDNYQVYWTTDSSWNTLNQNLSVTGTSYTVSGLTAGTTYYFRLSAHNSAGYGGWTDPVSAALAGGGTGIMHPANGLGLDTAGHYVTDYSNVGSYGLVITSAQGAPQAKTLSALTLIYSDGSQIQTAYSEGLSYATASANGCLFSAFQPGRYVFDHTKSVCNQLMADADVAYVKQMGLKGMFLDDTVPQNPYGTTTPAGWEAGMVSFVHLLHQELNASGLYLLTNANAFADPTLGSPDNGAGDVNWAKQLAPDGVMEESWMETRDSNNVLRPSGASWNQNWDSWQSAAKQIQAAGIDFIGMSYNMTSSYVPYTYASTLMADAGRIVYMPAHTDGSDPWNSVFTTSLGTATGSVTTSGTGRYKTYSSGKAVVNTAVPGSASLTLLGLTLGPVTGYVGP